MNWEMRSLPSPSTKRCQFGFWTLLTFHGSSTTNGGYPQRDPKGICLWQCRSGNNQAYPQLRSTILRYPWNTSTKPLNDDDLQRIININIINPFISRILIINSSFLINSGSLSTSYLVKYQHSYPSHHHLPSFSQPRVGADRFGSWVSPRNITFAASSWPR